MYRIVNFSGRDYIVKTGTRREERFNDTSKDENMNN